MPRSAPLLSIGVALLLVGCEPSSPGPTRSASPPAPAAPTTAGEPPSPSGRTGAPPASTETASPAPAALACVVAPQNGLLPSDRLVDVAVTSTQTGDLVTFVFAPSTPGPGGPPRGTLAPVDPPFSFAGSGLAIDLLGGHAVQLLFSGMTIAGDGGEAIYQGPADVKPDLAALKEAIQYDASEGIVGWYVGYDGPGCVTLSRDGNDVTVMIERPAAPAG